MIKRIPYAITNFSDIIRENMYYVDKTQYIKKVEEADNYFFFIRPRRFGKTLFLQMLTYYYDINRAGEFEELFGNLWIGQHPTPMHNKCLTMALNFSEIDGDMGNYRKSLDLHCKIIFEDFCRRYSALLPEGLLHRVENTEGAIGQLKLIYTECYNCNLPIYIFLDEYDHFTNDILAAPHRLNDHENETHGEGYLRKFFNALKAGSSLSLKKLFVTGVSPVTMDDVTSGFNIGTNYSDTARFNNMVGFSEEEVRDMLTYYREATGVFNHSVDELIEKMKPWYDNYCFAKKCIGKPTMYNSDMVLYFLKNYIDNEGDMPDDMLDANMRSDYNKLRMLLRKDRGFGENSSTVQTIVEKGQITASVINHFPARDIVKHENFVSLMWYFGMLTYGGEDERGVPVLTIPNECVREQTFKYMLSLYEEEGLSVDELKKSSLIADMAFDGNWRPYFDFIAESLKRYSSLRDKINGESYVHGFTMGQTCLSRYYLPLSEEDQGVLADGYSDIFFMPRKDQYKNMKYAYIIEFKYLKHDAPDAQVQAKIDAAIAQANRYAQSEKVQTSLQGCQLIKLYVVYRGMEMVAIDEIH